jgi:hypothetical protein
MKETCAMKHERRRTLLALLLLASAQQGCGGHDRQMVYPAPRGTPVRVDTTDGVRVKAPFVNVNVPASRPLPPAKGIDVPIVDPD